jgi:hypothetical protein
VGNGRPISSSASFHDTTARRIAHLLRLKFVHSAWRLLDTVKTAPLVVINRRIVLRGDLVECSKVMPDRVVKNFYLKHRPYHERYFFSDQTPDDVALFKSWISTRNRDFTGESGILSCLTTANDA